jgi:hypothetical protein
MFIFIVTEVLYFAGVSDDSGEDVAVSDVSVTFV